MKWEQIQLVKDDSYIFCNTYISGKDAMNIIVSHTPICSTLDVQPAYEALIKYPVNIFAFDFSGTGKSGGKDKNFSFT